MVTSSLGMSNRASSYSRRPRNHSFRIVATTPPPSAATIRDKASTAGMSLGEECRRNLLRDHFDRIARGVEAGKVRENAAVLPHLVEADAVQHGNQRLFVQEGPEFSLGPEPT